MHRQHSAWWLALGLAIILALVANSARAQSPARSLTLAEYRAELEAAIAQLEAIPEADAAPVIEALQERFAAIQTVELPTGEQIAIISILADVSTDAEDEPLPDGANDLLTPRDIAFARLRGAMAQMDATAHDQTAARLAILQSVLARPEFNTPRSLWVRFWEWLENLARDLLPESGGNATWRILLLRLLPWIVTIFIVAAVIWLLTYWLQRFLRSFVSDARVAALAGDADLPRSAAEARQQAHAAAQSGHYRDAVRRLYLAALLQLAEHDLITYERSLTNREVLVRVPQDSPIRAHLEPVIATFDQVWYGVREPDQATFMAYEQEIDTLASVAQHAVASNVIQRTGESPREGEA